MAPAQRLDNWTRLAVGKIEAVIAIERVGLQNAGVAGQMPLGMLARSIARSVEQSRRRILAPEWPVVAHVDPDPAGLSVALGEDRHGGVVAVQPIASQDMTLNQPVQRAQPRGANAHLIGQRRQAQFDALAGVALALAVQRLMLAELFEQDHRQEVRAGEAARRDMERRRRLRDRFALPTGEALANRLDHLPSARDDLQRLRDILAEL
jgi:hypothetical protein